MSSNKKRRLQNELEHDDDGHIDAPKAKRSKTYHTNQSNKRVPQFY